MSTLVKLKMSIFCGELLTIGLSAATAGLGRLAYCTAARIR